MFELFTMQTYTSENTYVLAFHDKLKQLLYDSTNYELEDFSVCFFFIAHGHIDIGTSEESNAYAQERNRKIKMILENVIWVASWEDIQHFANCLLKAWTKSGNFFSQNLHHLGHLSLEIQKWLVKKQKKKKK